MNTRTVIPNVQLKLEQPCQAIEISGQQEGPFLEPHRHDYWELVWCQENQGTQSIDFIEYDNRRHRFFTIAPGQVHFSESMGNNVRLLVFASGLIDNQSRGTHLIDQVFRPHSGQPPYIDCHEEALIYLSPLFHMLEEECKRDQELIDLGLISALIEGFLRYLLRYASFKNEQGKLRDPRINQLFALIEQHYRTEKKCAFYADKMALTSKRLNELLKAERGKTLTQLIHERLILEANRDLAHSTKTIKTIGLELGFEDPAYFSRFYRKQRKESPAKFRLRCSNNTT
ncbi:helix-turn-helix domain-containing protein [Vibrio neptunius]|uniref:Helix-turn-helix domain-containing protein n=1 Tax=Vibrio neptunius TaxID=170651 RepID=A0ABS3A6K5_9VIBR|nr:helix-turn-helix domain-containing protein [Vibrio neptunius]MBN3494609.1 helix-turn-helix domain-containing protein [Vibrio neptunius]MBN3517025.1 helix-turn-helix domain-containing protein [Vibrio neptunius]MBN3551516.1 helix-turn-helix domain-containing protein [Vibrio neptunius]MBN3579421.1 helix-turn-helix domain-containing protein [Vibrio neptunius]MCH9873085.1 helix-turn-helix domain-containing protein [Vibrio neptunius]